MDEFTIHNYAISIFYENIDKLIKNNIFVNRTIIIFGSSRISLMINSYLLSKNIKINYFIDNYSKAEFIQNVPVYLPDELLGEFNKDALILIASAFQNEMVKQLEAMGYQQDIHIIKVIDLPELLEDYSFVDRKDMIPMPQEEIKQRQLKALKFLNQICEQNDIWYCLAYGTLLGAVRHGGYIPWDDDIDVYVKNEDIDKLYYIIKQEEDYSYILAKKCESFIEHLGLLVDNHSLVDLNRFPTQITTGISIDICPLYGQPETGENIYFSTLKSMEEEIYCNLYDIKLAHSKVLQLENYLMQYEFSSSHFLGDMFSSYHSNDRFHKDVFSTRIKMKFEDEYYYVPKGYDQYLKTIYGDYMQYPPVEKRIQRHFYKAYYKP